LQYDTIYAHQDKEDDLIVGVKSSALALGSATRPWIGAFFALATVLIGVAGALVGLGWPFYLLLAVAAGHFAWQTLDVDIDDPRDCLSKFRSNQQVGLLIFAAIVAGQVIR